MDDDKHEGSIRLPRNGNRITIILAVFSFMSFVGNLYLSNGYVSKLNYERDQKDESNRRESLNIELRNVAIELKGISDHMQGDARQDKRIDDLEARVRQQEFRK